MVEISKSAHGQNSTHPAPPTSSVPSSKNDMEGKKEAERGENGVGVMILSDEEERERKMRGRGGGGGQGGRDGGGEMMRERSEDSASTRSGVVCCNQGRVWIFLILGVLTLVFSAVLVGIYMNLRTLTSSMHLVEVIPSYIPAVVGGVAALSVLLLFWRRSRPLMYIAVLLCASAAVVCIITAVLTGTQILDPILSADGCQYIRITKTCRCITNNDELTSTGRSVPPSYLTMEGVVGCSVVEDILPNMLFTVVGIYGVIALVCTINGLISLLVCRMELNRKRMQGADYGANYSTTPTSSSESFMEHQTMLPSQLHHQQQQQQLQLQQQLQQQQQQQQQQLANSRSNPTSVVAVNGAPPSTISTANPSAVNALANIYTNTNAIDDATSQEDGQESPPSDVPFSASDFPVGDTAMSQMKRSKSFSQPRRSTLREGSPQSSSSAGSQALSSVLGGASDEERRLIPKRKKTRRAVTLHGLDRDQLMLILSLQMRYLEESQQDSKKPEGFSEDNVNASLNNIIPTTTVPDSPSSSSSESSDDAPSTIRHMEVKRASSMEDVVSGNLNAARLTNQAFVGSEQLLLNGSIPQRVISTQHPGQYDTSTNGVPNSSAFTRMQRRAMTPTPRQERLSSCRTTDDEMEFQSSKIVRSHTPQPHHFRNERQTQHQQQVLQEQQRQQYLLEMQQEYQYWSLQQQLHQEQLQKQQQQIQELQFQNMRQKQEILLQQQHQQIERQQQQQVYNGLPPQQHPLNQQYHQIIQQQLQQAPFAGGLSETVSSSTLDNSDGTGAKNNPEDDEPATHITIDLRDITKTGPVIYENTPTASKLNSIMSHNPSNANSVASIASTVSTLRELSTSPQPKSILKAPLQITHQAPPPDLHAAMMRQISTNSTTSLLSSSGTGSVSSEIQNAFSLSEQPITSPGDVTNNGVKEGSKNEEGKIKWTKKLSMKLKRDKKDKDKEVEKINSNAKIPMETDEKDRQGEIEGKEPTSTGLARSDSDVRRSGAFPDRWQAIMVDSAVQQTPQTLWENVQRKIVAEPEEPPVRSGNPPPYPGKPQVPVPPGNAIRSAPVGIEDNTLPNPNPNPFSPDSQHYAIQNGMRVPMHSAEPNQSVPPPNSIMYSNTVPSLHPGLPMGDNSHRQGHPQGHPTSQPPIMPMDHQNNSSQPIARGLKISDQNSFLPITQSQSPFSDDYAIDSRPATSTKPNLRRSNSLVDPNAPLKPPRLQQLNKADNINNMAGAGLQVQGQIQRPRSYVKAVDPMDRSPRTGSSNNSSMSGEEIVAAASAGGGGGSGCGLPPRSAAVRMQMEGPVRREFSVENNGPATQRNALGLAEGNPFAKYNGDQIHPTSNFNARNTPAYNNPLSPRQQHKPMPVPMHPSRSHGNQNPMSNPKFYPPFNGVVGGVPPGHTTMCDTDLDDLPIYRPNRGQQVQPTYCPPSYAPPPRYRSMESVARKESIRSTSSSSSEPHNTSATLSEPHNTSYTLSDPHNTSSDRCFTPPLRSEFQRNRVLPQGSAVHSPHPRGRPIHSRGRNLSLGSRQRSAGSRPTYRSPTVAYSQEQNDTPVPFGASTHSSQSPADAEPYMLMRRCQSVEDKDRPQHALREDFEDAYMNGPWPRSRMTNKNNSSSSSSGSTNGLNGDSLGFSPKVPDIRKPIHKNTNFSNPNHNNGHLRKNMGPKKTNQGRELRQAPLGIGMKPDNTINFPPTVNGSQMISRPIPIGNSSMSPPNGNFLNGPMPPPRNQGRIVTGGPANYTSDELTFVSDNAANADVMGVSWDSTDDDIVNRPLRKLTLSGSEEIVNYMAGMDGVSPDGDDGTYAESVI